MDRQRAATLAFQLKQKVNNIRTAVKGLNGPYEECLKVDFSIGTLEKVIYEVIQELDNESTNTETT